MSREKEVKEKLAQAQADVRRLKADLASIRAINKVKIDMKPFKEYLTEDDRQRIPDKARKWLPEEYVQPVLLACASYRFHRADPLPDHVCLAVLAPGNPNPATPPGHLKRGKGRPPGGDICAKALINHLALIWLAVFKKLPRKGDNTRFGKFVADIARGLKEATWPGIVNEVLRGQNHERYREAYKRGLRRVRPCRETFAAAKDENWLEGQIEKQKEEDAFVSKGAIRGVLAVSEKWRVEAEIEKILDSVQDEIVLKLIDSKIIKRRKNKMI